ncbi:hypothetical protein CEE45_02360 [Candidatus Heimdallarchaeota archaeon B3_Heim]|nr:MAG: hypothetical protein CEE45_02360 [Candidatus Heimdallarchaeota archaeon B3_Heim]
MEEKPRFLVYGLLSALLAGFLYIIVFIVQGLAMDPPDMFGMLKMMGSMMGDIGLDPVMVGLMFHSVMGTIILGITFGILLILLKDYFSLGDRNKQLLFGFLWGIFVFMVGPLMMVPMMSGDPLFDLSLVNMISGVGHMVWGPIMGYLVYSFDNKGYFK